jgi:hypothetical protein
MLTLYRIFILFLITYIFHGCLVQKRNKSISDQIELTHVEAGISYDPLYSQDTVRYMVLKLKNNSDSAANFYEEWNMWGWYNFYFEILSSRDTIKIFRKYQRAWDKNYPAFTTLKKGDFKLCYITRDTSDYGFYPIPEKFNGLSKLRFVHQLEMITHSFRALNNYLHPFSNKPLSKKDSLSLIQIYNRFPREKILSKEYNVEISNGTFRIVN